MSALLPRTAADFAQLAWNAAMAEQDERRDDIIDALADKLLWLEANAARCREEMHEALKAGDERDALTAAKYLKEYTREIDRIIDGTRHGADAYDVATARRMAA